MSFKETQINPRMVLLARESRGLSQTELAQKLNTTQGFVSRVETDMKSMSEETLARLSKILKYPPAFFYREGEAFVPMSLNFRKRDHVNAKALMPFEAQCNLYRLAVETLAQKIKLPGQNIPALELKKAGSEEQAAKQLRKYWKLPKGPVENLTELLETNGIIVISFDFGTERIDSRTILTKEKDPIIVVNKNHLADRQRFSLAHELGHLVMHSHALPSHERDISHEANMFAAGFLLPESEVRKDLEADITLSLLAGLKKKWKVSMIALLYRAVDLGFLTENQKKYMLAQFNQRNIRRREPVELDFPKEKPQLLRNLVTKYKNAHRFSVKELAAAFHLEVEEFMQKYSE
jgi:Zn-dependent peptidase ImmA (M78 family)/transcriptional regulator